MTSIIYDYQGEKPISLIVLNINTNHVEVKCSALTVMIIKYCHNEILQGSRK